jgi:hypothetical protein
MSLTKAQRVKRARQVRRALSVYLTWQEKFMAEAHPDRDPDEQRWGCLLAARAELDRLVREEREAGGTRWAAFVARRGGS